MLGDMCQYMHDIKSTREKGGCKSSRAEEKQKNMEAKVKAEGEEPKEAAKAA